MALKALRRRPTTTPKKIVADAFDYIEYPQDAQPARRGTGRADRQRAEQFLVANTVKGDRVAVSVSGQTGLARFIKLPPVEAKKIPDIVRYEARQQIPFDLNDVIWDYQRIGGGAEEEGIALETEIGLFAMKRDAVFRADPFWRRASRPTWSSSRRWRCTTIVLFDQLGELPPADEFDPENPPRVDGDSRWARTPPTW